MIGCKGHWKFLTEARMILFNDHVTSGVKIAILDNQGIDELTVTFSDRNDYSSRRG